ncbi:MAG: methyltransferase [Nitrospira defluvii]|nr:methyltransferase [Nitrospira defluvii]
MTSPSITTIEAFRATLAAYRLPRVIVTALELDLFTAIATRTWSVAKLAETLDVSERGLDILCRNLAMGGLLKKRGNVYRNSSFAATQLNAKHRHYRGAYIELLKSQWTDWSRLTETVRCGRPVDHDEPEAADYRHQFAWAMHHRSVDVAARIARQMNLSRVRTLLDLGGGPGTYAMAFLARYPKLKATICDRPAALEVAKEIAATHKARKRLSYLPLNFMEEDLPGQYDLVWYSNVLHIYSPDENQALFRRIISALAPGGRLIIQDAFLHDREGLYPEEASLFAVSMLLFTERGNTYSLRDTARWLKEAGYVKISPIKMKPGTEDWDGGLLEAARPARQ